MHIIEGECVRVFVNFKSMLNMRWDEISTEVKI
jgi:hypothetical protein